jgi:hypothetical protein
MMWSSWRDGVGALRRRCWVAAGVFALVALLALVRFAGPGSSARHQYVSSQVIVVSVLPPDSGGTYASARAQSLAASLATSLASHDTLSAPAFDRAVVARVAADRPHLNVPAGSSLAALLDALDAPAVAAALSATDAGDHVTITARSPNATASWIIASAAGETLAADPTFAIPASTPVDVGLTVRLLRERVAASPALDPAPEVAARARLWQTLLLGLLSAIGLSLFIDLWERRAHASSDPVNPDAPRVDAGARIAGDQ